MNVKKFFDKLVLNLDLGNLIEEPSRVSGGLTHKMYKIVTNKSKYIVKLLNPSIMKRPTAMTNFNKVDLYEDILKEHNIKAVYALKFNDKKMQEIDGQYFYVYEWYEGKSLKDGEITEYHCKEMGKVLAKIHNIDLVNNDFNDEEKNIDFKYYVDLCKQKESPIYELLYDNLDILNNSMKKGNEAIKKLPNYFSICHNDMDPKNVMWLGNDYRIIDLECLGYYNPYLELYELALCWSGYEKCDINFNLFKIFFESYFENTILDKNVDWESIYYTNNGRLEWLQFNIKRSLMIECDTKEEQEMGLNEVRETIEHAIYYDKVKNEILSTIDKLIK